MTSKVVSRFQNLRVSLQVSLETYTDLTTASDKRREEINFSVSIHSKNFAHCNCMDRVVDGSYCISK